MIKVINEESYEWLLNLKNIKSDYVKKYIELYIEDIFNIKIDLSDNNVEFDLDSAVMFGSIQNILDDKNRYKVSKNVQETDTYVDKKYISTKCKYDHEISLIGDFENYEYLFSVSINDSLSNLISDQELINLYKEDDEILLSLISEKKGDIYG